MDIARLIPDAERADILNKNIIANAAPVEGNENMHHLMVIWRTYLEPTLVVTCNTCFEKVIKGFRNMQDSLIELEKQHRLLRSA